MATTETSFAVISLEEAALAKGEDRARVRLRRELDIGAFGVSAVRQAKAGESVIGEHDEIGPAADGHEELYIVVSGGCTFTVDGEEVAAPQSTAVFVRNPEAKRSAVATDDGTIVVAIGGRRGEAFRVTPGEEIAPFFPLYQDKDYEGALDVCHQMLEKWPGNALGLYNVACMESLLGRRDDALAHLRDAIDASARFKENAIEDEDFASLRDDPRFEALVA